MPPTCVGKVFRNFVVPGNFPGSFIYTLAREPTWSRTITWISVTEPSAIMTNTDIKFQQSLHFSIANKEVSSSAANNKTKQNSKKNKIVVVEELNNRKKCCSQTQREWVRHMARLSQNNSAELLLRQRVNFMVWRQGAHYLSESAPISRKILITVLVPSVRAFNCTPETFCHRLCYMWQVLE